MFVSFWKNALFVQIMILNTFMNLKSQWQKMWLYLLRQTRNKPGYNVRSAKHPSSMPNKMKDKVFALQKFFMMENNKGQLQRKWVTVIDVNSFYTNHSEISRKAISNLFGELMEGRCNGCLTCHQCYLGLWTCNILFKKRVWYFWAQKDCERY